MEILAKYPLVEGAILDLRYEDGLTSDKCVARIYKEFDKLGPFYFAKKYDFLVNGSGEEFAIQWMSFYNEYTGYSVY